MEIRNLIDGNINYNDDSLTIKECLMNASREKVNLSWSDLRWSDLSESDLRGSSLKECDLRGSDLRECNLSWSDLSWSDLSGCNLSGCNLSGCNLSGCNLRGCNLSGCNLSGCNLSGCNLSGCNLSESIGLDYAQISFNGFGEKNRLISLVDINRNGNPIFFCGCFKGNNEELINYIDDSDEEYKESRHFARKTLLEMIKFSNNKNK